MPSLVCFERVSPNTHHKFFYCFMFLTEFRSCLLSCCAWSVNRPAAHLKLKQSVVCAFYLITMCVSPRNVYNTNCISAFLYSLVSLDPSGALSLSLCVCLLMLSSSHSQSVPLQHVCSSRSFQRCSGNAHCPWSPPMQSDAESRLYTTHSTSAGMRTIHWAEICSLATIWSGLHAIASFTCRQINFMLCCFVALRFIWL